MKLFHTLSTETEYIPVFSCTYLVHSHKNYTLLYRILLKPHHKSDSQTFWLCCPSRLSSVFLLCYCNRAVICLSALYPKRTGQLTVLAISHCHT